MMLDDAAIATRRDYLTGTNIRTLMQGTAADLLELWREKTGDPSWKPKDLSGAWPVQLGYTTEKLNLDWYERKEGHTVSRRGEFRSPS